MLAAAGELITPYRNGDDPYAAGQHRGIDIAGPVGAPVVAAAGGERPLRRAPPVPRALTVSIRTTDGFDTSYLHLSSLAVRAGERVAAGDRLGAVGTIGPRSAERAAPPFRRARGGQPARLPRSARRCCGRRRRRAR